MTAPERVRDLADVGPLVDGRVPAGFLINGEWVTPSGGEPSVTVPVVDPGTGAQFSSFIEATESSVDAAVSAAHAAAPAWRRTSVADRAALLLRLADLIDRDKADIALLESVDNGKPYGVALGHDVANAISTLRYYAELAASTTDDVVAPVFAVRGEPEIRVTRVPLGVVVGLIPWNAPFMTAVWKLAPALAFGNTVVLKPAEDTSLSTLYLGALTQEAGFPAGVVNIVTGSGSVTGAALVRHRLVDKISFTGSTEVGREILTQSAVDFKRVGLELGGKSSTILLADAAEADVKRAASLAVWAMFVNAGQVCSAGSRLLIQSSVYEQTLEAVATAVSAIRVGYGLDKGTQLGPLVSQKQRERVNSFVTDPTTPAPLVGGHVIGGDGYFFEPTVVVGPKRTDRIWQEEVFGPVLCVTEFGDLDEAVQIAEDTRYGLAAGIITNDRDRADDLASRLNVGTVWVNAHNMYDPAVPWGGMKESGLGRELGYTAAKAYTEEKVLWLAG